VAENLTKNEGFVWCVVEHQTVLIPLEVVVCGSACIAGARDAAD